MSVWAVFLTLSVEIKQELQKRHCRVPHEKLLQTTFTRLFGAKILSCFRCYHGYLYSRHVYVILTNSIRASGFQAFRTPPALRTVWGHRGIRAHSEHTGTQWAHGHISVFKQRAPFEEHILDTCWTPRLVFYLNVCLSVADILLKWKEPKLTRNLQPWVWQG